MKRTTYGLCLLALLWAVPAAALSDADKCEAAKNKEAGKYAFCRQKAEATAIKKGLPPNYTKCDSKLTDKWGKAETKGGGMCPTNGDLANMQARITTDADAIAACLNGACLSALLVTGQTTSYGPGSDGDVQAGVARSYTDNGDGTITDSATGLMWEKKSDDGSIHDKDKTYTWCADVSPMDFTCDTVGNPMDGTILLHVAVLNAGSGFAGHTDWRIPNVNELQSIVNYETFNPAVGTAFNTGCAASCTVTTCSCTQSTTYWSSTTDANSPLYAWTVYFSDGNVFSFSKSGNFYVRAVRGGL